MVTLLLVVGGRVYSTFAHWTLLITIANFLLGYRYYVGLQPFVLVSDLDLLKKITVTDFEYFMDRPVSITWVV